MNGWQIFLRRLARQIWFRAAVFSLVGVLLALASRLVVPVIPYEFRANVGQDSVDSILQILAASMLAVTTFSLTAMVSAYASASTIATPRAAQLLIADPTSQNALSTFLGGFLFAIVGIIALSTDFYGEEGRIILFIGTVAVVAVIAITLLRWIAHITGFGRMADVIDRVEDAAIRSMQEFAAAPSLGGRPPITIPARAVEVRSGAAGYVIHVDVPALERVARTHDLEVHVLALPGTHVHPGRPLVRAAGRLDDAIRAELCRAFDLGRHRNYDQDPRLGLIALAEIGSRALSPSTNDPGTAIEVLGALHRTFLVLLRGDPPQKPTCERVFVPRPALADMVADAFRPISRDGAGMIEVGIRIQKTLAALAAVDRVAAPLFAEAAANAAARAREALADPADRAALAAVRAELWPERRGDAAAAR
jgi:uncharacterized membrane protein